MVLASKVANRIATTFINSTTKPLLIVEGVRRYFLPPIKPSKAHVYVVEVVVTAEIVLVFPLIQETFAVIVGLTNRITVEDYVSLEELVGSQNDEVATKVKLIVYRLVTVSLEAFRSVSEASFTVNEKAVA